MKRVILMRITVLTTVCALCKLSIAQNSYSKFAVGAGINANVYQGDLTPRRIGSIETIKPGVQIWGSYCFKDQWTAQLSAGILRLKGDDSKYSYPAFRKDRNFVFTSTIKEIEAKMQYSLYKPNAQDYKMLFPYVGAGVGFGFYKTIADGSGLTSKLSTAEPWIAQGLAADVLHQPVRRQIYFPLIAGVKMYYTPRIDLYAEANYKMMFTDYLDGFSQSAGKNAKDKYYAINVGAIYKFYKANTDKMGCPKW